MIKIHNLVDTCAEGFQVFTKCSQALMILFNGCSLLPLSQTFQLRLLARI